MSIQNLQSLEGRVERLSNALAALQQQVSAQGQTQWALVGYPGSGGGGGNGLIRAALNASLGVGSLATPATAAGTICVPNGSGGWTQTGGTSTMIYSHDVTPITVSTFLFCWVQLDPSDGNYYLVSADC